MPLVYPRKLDLACTPTPLQYLERASQKWGDGHRLWVKRDDLTGCTLSGNKVRKLEFIAAYAQDNGYDTLITCGGLQSNHCRATALAACRCGMKPVLFLRTDEPDADPGLDGNLLLDRLTGADLRLISRKDYADRETRTAGAAPSLISISRSRSWRFSDQFTVIVITAPSES